MARQFISVLATTITAAGAIAAERFVTFGQAQAGAAARTLGVARTAGAIGDPVPVDVLGFVIVTSGGAIPAGSAVETDAQGRAVVQSSGPTVARAAPGAVATAAGQPIQVFLIPN